MTAATAMLPGADAAEDERFMALALTLGRRALGNAWPNPAVGAIIVRHTPNGPIVLGRGWTQPGGRPHAETEALNRAGAAARGATLYTTLEPCSHHGKTPPCVDAIIRAGIARVVSAIEDPNPEVAGKGHARLRAQGLAVTIGPGAEDARRVHAGHIRRIHDGRPHVVLKLAISADGKAGVAGPKPVQISGERARDRVHLMRAMSDVILIGIDTAIADDPQLTCRLPGMANRSPHRIILDTYLRLPLGSRMARTARDVPVTIVAGLDAPADRERALRERGIDVFRVESSEGRLDLPQILRLLGQIGVTRLMVEGGPHVAASFVEADLVDEAALIQSPMTIGPQGLDALAGLPLSRLTAVPLLRQIGSEQIAADTILTFERVSCSQAS